MLIAESTSLAKMAGVLVRLSESSRMGLCEWVSLWAWACQTTPREQTRFGCFDYSFISFILPPMMLLKAPRRLP